MRFIVHDIRGTYLNHNDMTSFIKPKIIDIFDAPINDLYSLDEYLINNPTEFYKIKGPKQIYNIINKKNGHVDLVKNDEPDDGEIGIIYDNGHGSYACVIIIVYGDYEMYQIHDSIKSLADACVWQIQEVYYNDNELKVKSISTLIKHMKNKYNYKLSVE